ALDLDRGILRRDLLDPAGELRQQRPDRVGRRPDLAGLDHPALGIVGIALLAPGHREAVALAAVHHEGNRLGGLAERDRQAAGCQRIERAGMSGAPGLEQPLEHGNRVRRGHADRLVENHPAVDVALVASRLIVLARLLGVTRIVVAAAFASFVAGATLVVATQLIWKNIFFGIVRIGSLRRDRAARGGHSHHLSSESGARSRCTAGVLSNFSIRSASSNRSSTRKRRSGANFRLTRRATSPRRNFLLRSSAAMMTSVSRPPSGIT